MLSAPTKDASVGGDEPMLSEGIPEPLSTSGEIFYMYIFLICVNHTCFPICEINCGIASRK